MLKLALISLATDVEHSPVNLAYLATYLKKYLKDKIDIKIIDINYDNIPISLCQYKPDIIGISAMTVHYETAKKLASLIKKHMKIPIIIGGVHISTCTESLNKDFDIAVIGEGEKTSLKLMKLYLKDKSFPLEKLKKISGLAFFENEKLIKTKRLPMIKNLDELPIPDRQFLNPKYFEPKKFTDLTYDERFIRTELVTSRGCPYKCIFCSTSHFWETVRFNSPKRIVEEIVYLNKQFNVNNFQITDDLFAFNKKRLLKIKELLKKNNLLNKIKLYCQIRGNLVNEELLDILKSMNVISVNIGLEAGSNRMLQKLKGESITIEQNKNAVILCKKYGMDVHGSFIIGSPTETEEDMKKTISLMRELKDTGINNCWCGVATPWPKTEFWEIAKSNNLVSEDMDWDALDYGSALTPFFLDHSVKFKNFLKLFKTGKNLSIDILKQNSNYKESRIKRYIKNKIFFNKTTNSLTFKIRRKLRYRRLENNFKMCHS